METLKEMNKKERKKVLSKVAKKIFKICSIEEEFSPPENGSEKELVEWLTEAYQLITPDDKLPEEIIAVFAELGISPASETSDTDEEAKEEENGKEENGKEEETKNESPKIKEKKKEKKPTKKKEAKKVGVISTIVSLIESSGKKGITKDQILSQLVKEFPDRKKDSMKATISTQVPNRISKEKFTLGKTDKGGFFKK